MTVAQGAAVEAVHLLGYALEHLGKYHECRARAEAIRKDCRRNDNRVQDALIETVEAGKHLLCVHDLFRACDDALRREAAARSVEVRAAWAPSVFEAP